MNSGPPEKLYDTTGIAAALSSLIYTQGLELQYVALQELFDKEECDETIAETVEILEGAITSAADKRKRMLESLPNWQVSRSALVAQHDASYYADRLRAFDAEEADHSSDEAYADSLLQLALEMTQRDHAYRVACADSSTLLRNETRADGATSRFAMTIPNYPDEDAPVVGGRYAAPPDATSDNVVHLSSARRRRPSNATPDDKGAA